MGWQYIMVFSKIMLKKFLQIFVLWMIPVSMLLGYVVYIEYSKTLDNLKSKETINVVLGQRSIKSILVERVSDLSTITRLLKLHTEDDLYASDTEHIAEELLAFAEIKHVYDQVRLLDLSGDEMIRINFKDGDTYITPSQQLQNKSKRYYFKETVALSEGEVFISPLDLNVEHGEIEQPLKPMIRLGTPVYDRQGEKRGILILNYLAQNLLDKLSYSSSQAQEISLINANGYWLMHPDQSRVWGFMYDNDDERFQKYHQDIWEQIMLQELGQIEAGDGIITFESIYPLADSKYDHQHNGLVIKKTEETTKSYVWKVVSFLSNKKLQSLQYDVFIKFVYVAIPLFIALILISWRLAHHRLKREQAEQELKFSNQNLEYKVEQRTKELQQEVRFRKQAEEKMRYMATYDVLTGIPNRALFYDRLLTVMATNKRRKSNSGLLFIDLDGFKAVNDEHGHEAGDQLLKQVSQRMSHSIRASDTVGRYGGDEFVVLLHEIKSEKDAEYVAKEIITTISEQFMLNNIAVNIGCSIGIAIYNSEQITAEQYINKADEAMYKVKKSGKNNYKLAV